MAVNNIDCCAATPTGYVRETSVSEATCQDREERCQAVSRQKRACSMFHGCSHNI